MGIVTVPEAIREQRRSAAHLDADDLHQPMMDNEVVTIQSTLLREADGP